VSILLLLLSILYICIAVLPFFINGLFRRPVSEIDAGRFNPLYFFPFAETGIGWYTYELAMSSLGFTLFIVPIMAVMLGISLWLGWNLVTLRERRYALTVFIASILVVLFAFSPIGMTILSWLEID
jgi:hypothetical protein